MAKKRRSKPGKREQQQSEYEDHLDDVLNEDYRRAMATSKGLMRILERQLERFQERFGWAPGPDDPVFFDPDADHPKAINRNLVHDAITEAASQIGVRDAQRYAMRKTHMLIVPGVNDHMFTAEDKAVWRAAIAEFEEAN